MEEKRNGYSLLAGWPEGKKLLRRPRRRWVNNMKMKIVVWCEMDWSDSVASNNRQ
jgi:hypothetical protein